MGRFWGPSLIAVTFVPATLALVAGAACTAERALARLDPQQTREERKEIPVEITRDLDILFVIDNSRSMRDEQESLAANFDRFVDVLSNIEGGLPNVHIGVISTDIGAGDYDVEDCIGSGDNGVLRTVPPSSSCSAPANRYLRNVATAAGPRETNYEGDLISAFSCVARLGVAGCGFEQPLEAMRRALDGSNPENSGFLRPHAYLAVVIITDEDDCSAADLSLFDSDPALEQSSSNLGFLSSFRCFEFGVSCTPDQPRTPGPREACVPREGSPYLYSVDEYVSFLKSLKQDPSQVIVAGIIGNASPVIVGAEGPQPALEPACVSAAGQAAPAVRIQAFLDGFPERSTSTTICNDNLSDALTIIAELFARVLPNPCIEESIKLFDGEPDCSITDVRFLNQEDQEETIIGRCDDDLSQVPCYRYQVDETRCTNTESHLMLVIEREFGSSPPDTTVVIRCAA